MIAEVVAGSVEVVGDMVVAHEAALAGAPGIVINAGTGSIAYGRNEAGETARAGGFGYVISDEGSGHWIGVQAVAWIAGVAASGHTGVISDRVLQRWKLKSVDELVQYANSSPTPDFAALFVDVLEGEDRDPGAGAILERAGVALAQLAEPVYRDLWKPWTSVQLALTGGVFHNSATVRRAFCQQMKDLGLNALVRLADADAAAGALALARKLA
jgi:N-acetylglucosamine kinase-like BadF-type ATPase